MKKNYILVSILLIFASILSCLIIFKGLSSKDEKTTDENTEIIERITNFTTLEKFLSTINFEEINTNILENPETRLIYTTYTFEEGKHYEENEDTDEEAIYNTSLELFKKEYKKIYGEKYSIEKDIADSNSILIDYCDSTKNEICWRYPNISGQTVKMTFTNKTFKDNKYTITGSYKITSYESEEAEEKGTFELKYNIENNKEILDSIILKK